VNTRMGEGSEYQNGWRKWIPEWVKGVNTRMGEGSEYQNGWRKWIPEWVKGVNTRMGEGSEYQNGWREWIPEWVKGVVVMLQSNLVGIAGLIKHLGPTFTFISAVVCLYYMSILYGSYLITASIL